jgi:DNA-binding transcriptional MocR family regulator
MTKVFGLSWARAGWVLAPPEVCADIAAASAHIAGWYGFAFAAAGVRGMEQADALVDRAVALAGDRLARVDALVRARPFLHWIEPPGGVFGWVELTAAGLAPARALIDGACAERGVLVADGRFFGAPNAFRIGCTLSDESAFTEGLAHLADALDAFVR